MSTINRDDIRARGLALQRAAQALKAHFVGIDHTIDELIHAMRVWYVMPEALTRPVIINLWGMTGVGKTDLVRRLVTALEMQERFIEIELANKDQTKWFSSVSSVLTANHLNDSESKIILFDEVQRFRTIDREGKPLSQTKYSDFWELLSDGRLSRRDRKDLDFLLAELHHGEREDRRRAKAEPPEPPEPLDLYDVKEIKRAIGLTEDLYEIISMPRSELIRRVTRARMKKQIFEPVDHSKTLILISGNLDEAFSMAGQTAEADVDADIFSAFTEKVSVIDIKQALSRRFQPEQVARFGNIHLIYRSLQHKDFVALIHRETLRICANVERLFGIQVTVSKAVEALIYRNGVFPVQGVRPVFSSISDVLESNLSLYVLEESLNGGSSIAIDYDLRNQRLIATLSGGERIQTHYVGRLDRARQRNRSDVVANISVHEAGHAVAYVALFELAPLQLMSRVASSSTAGFTFPHDIYGTRATLLAKIQVFLAGGLAEELVFGESLASTGRVADRERATELAVDYVRRYGFETDFYANYTLDDEYKMNTRPTDVHIEVLLGHLENQTKALLHQHKPLLLELSQRLRREGKVDAAAVARLAKTHGLEAAVRPEGFLYVPSYATVLDGEK